MQGCCAKATTPPTGNTSVIHVALQVPANHTFICLKPNTIVEKKLRQEK